jgi:GNAT superfamily N-acetyltransferase
MERLPDHVRVAVLDADDLTDEHWIGLSGGDDDPFEVSTGVQLTWLAKDRYVALFDGDRMVARAGLVVVPVLVGVGADAVELDVVGFGGVIVAKDRRGAGLARAVMTEATRIAGTLEPAVGMLFCLASRAGLYAKLGWRDIVEPVTVEQPGGPHTITDHTMWTPLRPGASFPAGPVHVRSLPF